MHSRLEKKVNLYTYVFWAVFIFSLAVRILPILNNNIPFTTDQGRDMLDIRDIVVGHHLRLIGPTTSINGLFLGPAWYYFNIPPFILGGGHPVALVYWQIFFFQLAAIAIWLYFRLRSPQLGLILSSFFLLSPTMFYQSRYSWNANPIPFFLIFFFLLLLLTLQKPSWKRNLLLGLLSGISFQIDAALTIIFFPFALLFLFFYQFRKKELLQRLKNLSLLVLGFILTLLPQLLFELRHQFLNTKAFFDEITGKTNILGDKLAFGPRISSHLTSFNDVNGGTFELSKLLNLELLIIAIIFMIYRLKIKKANEENKLIFIISFFFLLFSFGFYSLYAYPIKSWYLIGLVIPYLFIIGSFFSELINMLRKISTRSTVLIFLAILVLSFNTFLVQTKLIQKGPNDRSGDRSNLRNEIEDIDWVYQAAQGKPFKLFSYMPSVYDFPYQYIVWWYGTQKYGYQPDTISYLENVPEYIPGNSNYLSKRKAINSDDNPIFLLMEKDHDMPIRQESWLGNFSKLCLKSTYTFYWETEIQTRLKCH